MTEFPTMPQDTLRMGVVIVTYGAADVIADCLETLFASEGVALSVVVVDNASPDGTAEVVRDWQVGRTLPAAMPFARGRTHRPEQMDAFPRATEDHHLAFIQTGANLGFAAAVNIGLAALSSLAVLDRFWVLNPDSAVPAGTAAAFASHPAPKGGFGMIGGRVLYFDQPEMIQIDGGVIDWRTGVTRNVNQFAPADAPPPDPAGMDFITGASMVVSRDFLRRAGPMPEDYFLYYEEVDWALQRGDLPLLYCPGGLVYHRAGSAIGSPAPGRTASPFSTYFKHRGRIRFLRRNRPSSLAGGWVFGLAKMGQLALRGDMAAAAALLRGMAGARPPKAVQARLPEGFAR